MQAEIQAELEVRAARAAKAAKEKRRRLPRVPREARSTPKVLAKAKSARSSKRKTMTKTKSKHRWLPCALHGRCHLQQQWQTGVQGLSQQELHQRGQGELGGRNVPRHRLGKSLGPV